MMEEESLDVLEQLHDMGYSTDSINTLAFTVAVLQVTSGGCQTGRLIILP